MFSAVKLPPEELAGGQAATSFAAGLNLYATVGLVSRTGLVELPPTLHLLTSW